MDYKSEVAAAEWYIRTTLKGSVALSAFTTTVEPQPLPREAALPAIGYTLIHANYVRTSSGARVFAKLDYRVVAIGLAQTILTLGQMDSIVQGLFGRDAQEARVNASTPYGTILAITIDRPHSLSQLDPATSVLKRYIGATYTFEVK